VAEGERRRNEREAPAASIPRRVVGITGHPPFAYFTLQP
jgi:hypothetical protein